jgi:hypothetical protein
LAEVLEPDDLQRLTQRLIEIQRMLTRRRRRMANEQNNIQATEQETQEQPRVHGNTRKAADMDLAKKPSAPTAIRPFTRAGSRWTRPASWVGKGRRSDRLRRL